MLPGVGASVRAGIDQPVRISGATSGSACRQKPLHGDSAGSAANGATRSRRPASRPLGAIVALGCCIRPLSIFLSGTSPTYSIYDPSNRFVWIPAMRERWMHDLRGKRVLVTGAAKGIAGSYAAVRRYAAR
ncbi:MAG: hypothetical protein JWM75_489 [Sphingomonas bacterium]|nr:hypothetical protein [Sphingomonas bacterium]